MSEIPYLKMNGSNGRSSGDRRHPAEELSLFYLGNHVLDGFAYFHTVQMKTHGGLLRALLSEFLMNLEVVLIYDALCNALETRMGQTRRASSVRRGEGPVLMSISKNKTQHTRNNN